MKIKFAVVLAFVLAGCAGNPHLEEGKRLNASGKPEQAMTELEAGLRKEPGNLEARAELERTRSRLVGGYVLDGERARVAGQFDVAEASFRRALGIMAGYPRAEQGLQQVEIDRRHQGQVQQAEAFLGKGEMARAEQLVRTILAQNPRQPQARRLAKEIEQRQTATQAAELPFPALEKPVNLQFRDTAIGSVFDILSRTSGINFVFDKDVRPDLKATIFVNNSSVREVVTLVLATNQLASKALNANSMLIFPNTPAKIREYQELVTKTFYLVNADVKHAQEMVKLIVKSRDVFINEKLNLLVVKDTAEAVRLAEKLLESLDKAEPEVMLEVEVLEISRNTLLNLGLQFPDQVGYGKITPDVVNTIITTTGTGTSTTFGGALAPGNINLRSTLGLAGYVANPGLLLNLKDQDGSSKLLANPRIRVKNREKAKVHIGDKVPVFTTTSTANVGVSSSVAYLDVGLKLDVQPNVSLDDEVSIKVTLEVSSIGKEVPGPGGSLAYQIGTRSAETTLRLRDGETQVLAGLISDEERTSANRLPGFGEIPVVGRLFSSTRDASNKTEIVLLITPRIINNVVRPEVVEPAVPSGSDSAVGRQPLSLKPATSFSLSSSGGAPAPKTFPFQKPPIPDRPTDGTSAPSATPEPAPVQKPAESAPSENPVPAGAPKPFVFQKPRVVGERVEEKPIPAAPAVPAP